MYDQEKEMADKSRKIKKVITYILATVTIALICWVVYVITWNFLEGDRVPTNQSPDNNQSGEDLIDVSLIPTFEDLDVAMGKAVKETYGGDIAYIMEQIGEGRSEFKIPHTSITLDLDYVGNDSDLMTLTALALTRNPYAINEKHPEAYKLTLGYEENTLREFPDGTQIDLATIKEKYSDIRYFRQTNDPTKLTVEGKVNGQSFVKDVDLYPYYREYANVN